MSNTINNGGPAFPADTSQLLLSERGMSMRDYFAGKAMQALMHEEKEMSFGNISVFAYAVADAMLRARGEA